MQSVQEIEIGTYEKPADGIPPADEIGQLSRSIDSMYQTIQQQFRQIKQDERENFQMELRAALRADQSTFSLQYTGMY